MRRPRGSRQLERGKKADEEEPLDWVLPAVGESVGLSGNARAEYALGATEAAIDK
jgi:hypothetical protein